LGLGAVPEPLAVSAMPILFEDDEWSPEAVTERFRDAVDDFAPDVVMIADSWNTKVLLAEAVAGYPYVLRLAAMETICPLNNVRLLFDNGQPNQCTRNQLADFDGCRACLHARSHLSGGLHHAERDLAEVDDPSYRRRLHATYVQASAVLVVNPFIADLVRPYSQNVHVVPSGFDQQRFNDLPNSGQDTAKTRFIFAGLVDEPMKGFSVLFEACCRLWNTRQDFELTVTSDSRADWDAPFIRWIGWQSQLDLPRAISAAEVLVFGTIAQEALGRTVVEAMGCGRPVIASRLGGLEWVVDEGVTGLLVNWGDPSSLCDAMYKLVESPEERLRLGHNGRAKFEREFTWPVIIERHYRPLIDAIVRENRGTSVDA
jgi:glycosyltransferase involved in cell wall biosynthesis